MKQRASSLKKKKIGNSSKTNKAKSHEIGNITTDPVDIRRIIREYYKYSIHINLRT